MTCVLYSNCSEETQQLYVMNRLKSRYSVISLKVSTSQLCGHGHNTRLSVNNWTGTTFLESFLSFLGLKASKLV